MAERARALGFGTHIDGARIWNASIASGIDVATWCAPFDTASVCFSKGLGAPGGQARSVARGHSSRTRDGFASAGAAR